jgi:hypothetical protein
MTTAESRDDAVQEAVDHIRVAGHECTGMQRRILAGLYERAAREGQEAGRLSGIAQAGIMIGQSGLPARPGEPAPTREALLEFVRSVIAAEPGEDTDPSSDDWEALGWLAQDGRRLLAEVPGNPPRIRVTRTSRRFGVDLAALRHAIANGATTLTFTAPEGWHFEDDRRLHPDSPQDSGDR